MISTAVFVVLVLQIPAVRRRIFSLLERLADWHEAGTAPRSDSANQWEKADPFLLARVGEKLLKQNE